MTLPNGKNIRAILKLIKMYDNYFVELMKIKIVKIHNSEEVTHGLNLDLSVIQFNRPTRSWYHFTYERWSEIKDRGWW